jgi:hypothetical protein
MRASLEGHWKESPGRASVIVLLLVHLLGYVIIFVPVGLFIEKEWSRAATLGTPGGATPYMVLDYTIIVALMLFVLALLAFLLRVRLSFVFAAIAGIGGVLVTGVIGLLYDLRMESLFADLMIIFMFTPPMIAIYLYFRA